MSDDAANGIPDTLEKLLQGAAVDFETITIPNMREFPKLTQIHGIPVLALELMPLQVPGQHHLDWEVVLGGPTTGVDSRLFLDVPTLERLLTMAKDSLSKKVQLDMCGIRIRQWVSPAPESHRYQTWTIVSLSPKPEHTIFDELSSRG